MILTRLRERQHEQQQMAKLVPGDEPKRSPIVTARKPAKAIPDGWLPDTPEEHQRRGDAADAMFQDMKRKPLHCTARRRRRSRDRRCLSPWACRVWCLRGA